MLDLVSLKASNKYTHKKKVRIVCILMHNMDMTTKPPEPVAGSKTNSRWSQDRRLEFIDFRLRWEGRINRSDITAFFGISVPQASLDIAKYLELAPENLVYDRSSRIYLAGQAFRPIFACSSTPHYLNDLLALEAGFLEPESSFMGWRPPTALVPTPGRQLNAQTLTTLLQAIREQRGVRVSYQSMTQPEPQLRDLSPHAIAHDGFRWHVRAYCHKRNDFLDFVIARILEIEFSESAGPGPLEDKAWQTTVEMVLAPQPDLSLSKRRAIELDYGMTDGKAMLSCRQALLFYLLKHLRLDLDQPGTPEAQQIVLLNEAEVKARLTELQR
jgi:hypothetical protein